MGDDEGKRSRKRRSSRLSASPSPSREDEGGSRKRRKRDEHDSKKRRRDEKREKRRSSKSEKSSRSRRDKKEGSSREKKKNKRSRKGSNPVEELSENDYFSKNNEFSAWLKEEKGIFFSDLSSEDARKLFSGFIKDWNKGKLESQYYEGIARGPRTAHNWKIKPEK